MKSRRSKRNAFTLLEIMLVVTIIALLLASAIYSLKGNVGYTQGIRAKADLQSIATQLLMYQGMNQVLPTTEQGLQALVTRPETAKEWRQGFPKVPVDPWDKQYIYVQPGKHNTDSYDLYSAGPDGVPDNT